MKHKARKGSMYIGNRRKRSTYRKGEALVEFSAVIVLVLTVLFGIIETGRLLFAYVAIADASRAGTRYAIVHGANSASPSGPGCSAGIAPNVESAAHAVITSAGLSGTTISVCYTGGNATGQTVTVTTSYPFTPIVPLVPLGSFTVSSVSEGIICY